MPHFAGKGATRIPGLSSSVASGDKGHPFLFANPKYFANTDVFADSITLGFAIAMINGFPNGFSKSRAEGRRLRRERDPIKA